MHGSVIGYRDRPLSENPARSLRCARLRKADRPKVGPTSPSLPFPLATKRKKPALRRAFCVLWLGRKDYSALRASPLRGRPRRVNRNDGANQPATIARPITLAATPSTADVILPVVAPA